MAGTHPLAVHLAADFGPLARETDVSDLPTRYTTWNELLQRKAESFTEDSPQASVFLFSSHKIVTNILDDPEEFDFSEDDATDMGSIWLDELHLTSEVHRCIAEGLRKAIETV